MYEEKYAYAMRIIEEVAYESHSGVSLWRFTNGVISITTSGGRSDKNNFPPGTIVLCRLKEVSKKGRHGYFFLGFAKVTKFSEDGRPIEFGDSLSNKPLGHWESPPRGEIIFDEREKGKRKEIW